MPTNTNLSALFPAIRPKLLSLPAGSGVYTSPDMLGPQHFRTAIWVAVSLHLFAACVWMVLPKPEVMEVPVRVISLKLGDGGEISAEERDAMAVEDANRFDVEAALAKLVHDGAAAGGSIEDMNKAAEEQEVRKHIVPAHRQAEVIQHYIRVPIVKAASSAESAAEKEIVARYQTLVELWVQKFQYMPDAKRSQQTGEATAHLFIDRRGNIQHYFLDASTGDLALDRATIETIRRANPVPAVPNDYPAGEHFEFVVPIRFNAQ